MSFCPSHNASTMKSSLFDGFHRGLSVLSYMAQCCSTSSSGGSRLLGFRFLYLHILHFFDFSKMRQSNLIQLCGDVHEGNIQIQCFHADFIAAHLEITIWCNSFFCFGIQKHTSHIAGVADIAILNIRKNLIQVVRMKGLAIILNLQGMGVILGVDNKDFLALS